jgi:assimilatory nitrate reductase catalytic subunit
MTRTGRVPRLMSHQNKPFLDLHPADLERLGLTPDGLARLETRHGATVLPVRPTADQRPGDAFVPMHWTDDFSSTGPVDRLVGAITDPISGQPELKGTPAGVTAVATFWEGLLLRRSELPLANGPFYWARTPIEDGFAFELAGWEPLPSGQKTEMWIAELLGAPPEAELMIYADPGRGAFRYASIVGDTLDACLFLARRVEGLPDRHALAAALGAVVPPGTRLSLLSGRSGCDNGVGDTGRAVCACFAIGLNALHEAIAERRLVNVSEIGAALGAGTNCGSCIPELKAILREVWTESGPAGACAHTAAGQSRQE